MVTRKDTIIIEHVQFVVEFYLWLSYNYFAQIISGFEVVAVVVDSIASLLLRDCLRGQNRYIHFLIKMNLCLHHVYHH